MALPLAVQVRPDVSRALARVGGSMMLKLAALVDVLLGSVILVTRIL